MYNLRDREWRQFFIEDICEIYSGVRLTKANMEVGDIPFIGATDNNNGITGFVSNKNSSYKSGVLGVNYNGSVVENFYHPYHAVFSDDVKQLRIKAELQSKYVYLFLKTVILQQKSKYAYGYKFNEKRMKRQLVMLPISKDGDPDWRFMEEYIKEREQLLIRRYRDYIQSEIDTLEETIRRATSIADLEWKEFNITELFTTVKRGKRLKKADHIQGVTPYASSKALNNGIDGFCGNSKDVRNYTNCLTLANSGSVGSCFYQPYSFVASDHVTALKNAVLDKYAYLFVAVLLARLSEKYSFNREISDKRLKREMIILPVDEEGNPNWDAMSSFVRHRELRLLKRYQEYLK